MQANVDVFSPQNLLFYADKSILRALIQLVRPMHALYSQTIGYSETPTLPVLIGPPSLEAHSASKNGRSGARSRQCLWLHKMVM